MPPGTKAAGLGNTDDRRRAGECQHKENIMEKQKNDALNKIEKALDQIDIFAAHIETLCEIAEDIDREQEITLTDCVRMYIARIHSETTKAQGALRNERRSATTIGE